MNTDLKFLLHYDERTLFIYPDEFPLFKRILEKMGFEQKLNRSKKLNGGINIGRCSWNPARVEIYLDEMNKLQDWQPSKEEDVIATLVHEYLHFAMNECYGLHEEEWIECMTEEALR